MKSLIKKLLTFSSLLFCFPLVSQAQVCFSTEKAVVHAFNASRPTATDIARGEQVKIVVTENELHYEFNVPLAGFLFNADFPEDPWGHRVFGLLLFQTSPGVYEATFGTELLSLTDSTARVLATKLGAGVREFVSQACPIMVASETFTVFDPATRPLSNLTATPNDQKISLSWTNPLDQDLGGVTIRVRTDTFPTSPIDGEHAGTLENTGPSGSSVLPGQPQTFVHTGLQNEKTYFYAAFTFDTFKTKFSAVVTASASPFGPVQNFEVHFGDQQNFLFWTNPTDSDFQKVVIRVRTDTFPTSPTDGTLVTEKAGVPVAPDSFVHTGLTNGVTYFYSIFAVDNTGNPSTAVTASAKPELKTVSVLFKMSL